MTGVIFCIRTYSKCNTFIFAKKLTCLEYYRIILSYSHLRCSIVIGWRDFIFKFCSFCDIIGINPHLNLIRDDIDCP